MTPWLYRIKIRQKLRKLSRRLQGPVRVASLDTFFRRRWRGSHPTGDLMTDRHRPSFFFNAADADNYATALDSLFPRSRFDIIGRADKVRGHLFNLLGSGDTYLGEKIDWHLDFKSGYHWAKLPFAKVTTVNLADDADVKVPWELSRLQHFTDLGRAFWLTGDKEYVDEFVNQLTNWEKENPVDVGVNWTCSMEVAIRAINIIWGLHFFSGHGTLDDDFVRRVVRLLYYHGLHIERNLEYAGRGSNNNHLLSNYLGLFYLGTLFSEFDRAEKWRDLASDGLEHEIRREVFDDGANYECSTSYHRLVLEIFLSAFILANKNATHFSREYCDRLGRMIEFSRVIMAPSGKAPLIGDNDDGFIVKLSTDEPSDHSRLVELGMIALGREVPDDLTPSEDRLWYHGPESYNHRTTRFTKSPRYFDKSGYAVIARDDFHLIYSAGRVTERCLAGHKHNDNLSITLEMDGVPYLIDPGTYCYTSDYRMRNRCRSTNSHNTVTVDETEQNRFFQQRLFHMFDDSGAKIDLWINTGALVVVSGVHRGYNRLIDRITHRRTVWAFLDARSISILDEFSGSSAEEHTFETNFLTPVSDVRLVDNTLVRINHSDAGALKIGFVGQGGGTLNVKSSEYYPRYGVRAPARRITYTQRSLLPFRNAMLISDCQTPTEWWNNLSDPESRMTGNIFEKRFE